jgi:hypothetical protein
MEQKNDAKFFSRKDRRGFLKRVGVLKQKKTGNLKKWLESTRSNIEKGKELHEQFLDAVDKRRFEILDRKEQDMRQSMKERGLKKKEIESRIDDWQDRVTMSRAEYKAQKKEKNG